MTHSGLTAEIQKLSPSAIVELFVIDATALGGDVLRFHAGTNGLTQNIVWQGDTYVRFPIDVSGFEFTGQGQFPRPKMKVANTFSAITTILLAYNDLLGAKVTRKRTLVKFLDAVNFSGGVNATADSTAEFSEDIYYIDRKSSEGREAVEFELAASVDLVGVKIPRRQIIQNLCPWRYRSAECSYTGAPLFDKDDAALTTATSAEGQAVLDAYADYVAAQDALDAAITDTNTLANTMHSVCEYTFQSRQFDLALNGTSTGTLNTRISGSYGYWVCTNNSLNNLTPGSEARWAGSVVSIGAQYRIGPLVSTVTTTGYTIDFYKIDFWDADATCASATTDYNNAVSAQATAQTNRDNALDAYNTAFAALPEDDPLYDSDVCGKRLESCKLRFGENNELPYGGFPAADLIK